MHVMELNGTGKVRSGGNVNVAFFFSDQFDEDLENNLISYFRPPIGKLDMLIIKVCHNLTKYCEGHDKEAERNKKDQVI